jgi:tetratricopeptide (TPR) repeat protein
VETGDVGNHVAVLEAFRHYLAADDDLTRARRFLRHSVASLLQRAHELSANFGRWKSAARLYREVLELEKRLRSSAPDVSDPIGKLPRAYATHYWHYNLYKQSAEPIEQTEAGYELALRDWPTNALFWSRLIVTKMVAGKWLDAFQTLDSASKEIPSPTARDRRLIERTTRKLLARSGNHPGFAIAALAVWRDHDPDDSIYGESTVKALQIALRKGGSVTVLPVSNPIVFHTPVRVSFTEAGGAWACRLDDLDVAARSESMFGALERAAAQLRADTRTYLSTLTHRLEAPERERKRLLLGRVDVVASAITTKADTQTWILAKVERDLAPPHVATLDGVPLDVSAVSIPLKRDDDDLWIVRVEADATGSPVPHVLAFEEALTGEASDSIWRRWAERWQHHA